MTDRRATPETVGRPADAASAARGVCPRRRSGCGGRGSAWCSSLIAGRHRRRSGPSSRRTARPSSSARRTPATSKALLFGTDYLGQDVWSRFLYGGRTILVARPSPSTAIGLVVGIVIGLVAAYDRAGSTTS